MDISKKKICDFQMKNSNQSIIPLTKTYNKNEILLYKCTFVFILLINESLE